jgi:hypothetical protein
MRRSWLHHRASAAPLPRRAADMIKVVCPTCGPVTCSAGDARVSVEATETFCELSCTVCRRALRVPLTDQATLMLLASEVPLQDPVISGRDEELARAADAEGRPCRAPQRDREP